MCDIQEMFDEYKRLSELEMQIKALTNYSLEEIKAMVITGELELKIKDVQE